MIESTSNLFEIKNDLILFLPKKDVIIDNNKIGITFLGKGSIVFCYEPIAAHKVLIEYIESKLNTVSDSIDLTMKDQFLFTDSVYYLNQERIYI